MILVLQTVIFPRFSFYGVMPDLVLVSVIAFAVFNERTPATVFSGAAGFLQDILSAGPYLNTVIKVLVCSVVGMAKERFMGDEYPMLAALVAIFTPLIVLAQWLMLYFLFGKHLDCSRLFFFILAGTLYNILMVPILVPAVRWVSRGD